MFIKKLLLACLVIASSSSVFAATYDCTISTYASTAKGPRTLCEKTTLSTDSQNNDGLNTYAYLAACGDITLSFFDIGELAGLNLELAKLKPGKEDWTLRYPLHYSVARFTSEEGWPKQLTLFLGGEPVGTSNDSLEYTADCSKR